MSFSGTYLRGFSASAASRKSSSPLPVLGAPATRPLAQTPGVIGAPRGPVTHRKQRSSTSMRPLRYVSPNLQLWMRAEPTARSVSKSYTSGRT